MLPKSYIALSFATIFFGNLLIMDSKLLIPILDVHEIVYVDSHCRTKEANGPGSSFGKIFSENDNSLGITLVSLCNTLYKSNLFQWEYKHLTEDLITYASPTPTLPKSTLTSVYRPPKAQNVH